MANPGKAPQDEQVECAERRETRRVPLEFHIEVSGREPGGKRFRDQTVTIDVNRGGCKFHSTRPLKRGDFISIRLKKHDGTPVSEAILFEVVRVEPGDWGWSIGATSKQSEAIWPMNFPKTTA